MNKLDKILEGFVVKKIKNWILFYIKIFLKDSYNEADKIDIQITIGMKKKENVSNTRSSDKTGQTTENICNNLN